MSEQLTLDVATPTKVVDARTLLPPRPTIDQLFKVLCDAIVELADGTVGICRGVGTPPPGPFENGPPTVRVEAPGRPAIIANLPDLIRCDVEVPA